MSTEKKKECLFWWNGVLGLFLLFVSFGNLQAQQKATIGKPVTTATARAPSVPVLKGLQANPVLRVLVTVPSGGTEQQYSHIQCTISNFSDVERVDVYVTGAEPFSAKNRLATVQPSAAKFNIPVTLNVKPGVTFIWLSVVLKETASINKKISLHCTGLVGANGNVLPVKAERSNFSQYTGYAIRKAWDDSVHTYRIPGIVQTDKGTLLSVYDIRYKHSGDLPANIDVGLSRSTDSGRTWQPMKNIMDMGAPHENNGIGDPAILFDPLTKKIWVAALWSKGNRSIAGSKPGLSPDTTGQFVLVSSDDDGITWSEPINITEQVKNPAWHLFFNGPGSGIAMQDGKLVFAAQYWDENKMPHSTIIYSDDHGKTWQGKLLGPKSNTTEAQVVETTPGTLMLNMRDNRGSYRSVATTTNMGKSWTEHHTSYNALPDPVCMASIIKARVNVKGVMRDVLFFSNVATHSGRYNMTIKASLDGGETWLPANQVLVDERFGFGYSSLTKVDNNTIGILYEGSRDLYFVKVPVRDIIK
ncbi:exo-alpha-sialidase [Flavisolibacter sp. BT320]|nr:exo-alpha-sialidase [Flavisolibacter longurius]